MNNIGRSRTPRKKCRSGLVLLVCTMVVALTSVLTLGVLETLRCRTALTTHLSAESRAELLAESGIQHAVANLTIDPTGLGTSEPIFFPIDSPHHYRYTVELASPSVFRITGIGISDFAIVEREVLVGFAADSDKDDKEDNRDKNKHAGKDDKNDNRDKNKHSDKDDKQDNRDKNKHADKD